MIFLHRVLSMRSLNLVVISPVIRSIIGRKTYNDYCSLGSFATRSSAASSKKCYILRRTACCGRLSCKVTSNSSLVFVSMRS